MYLTYCQLYTCRSWLSVKLYPTEDPDLESNLGPVESRPTTSDDVLVRGNNAWCSIDRRTLFFFPVNGVDN